MRNERNNPKTSNEILCLQKNDGKNNPCLAFDVHIYVRRKMTKFFEGAEYLFWVIVVGLIGGLLNLLDDEPHKRKDRRALHAAVGTASSMFVCWIVYEVVFFFSHVVPFSLAIGGFFAWQGAEYVKSKVDKALDKKIDGLGDRGYDYGDYGGYGGDFRHENFKDER